MRDFTMKKTQLVNGVSTTFYFRPFLPAFANTNKKSPAFAEL
jgi:hypothetical protein